MMGTQDPRVTPPFSDPSRRLEVKALFVGERIEVSSLQSLSRLADIPGLYTVGSGVAAIFRYGALVLFDVTPEHEEALFRELTRAIRGPLEAPEVERARLVIDAEIAPRAENGIITVSDADPATLLVVAEVLARSVALNHYERVVSGAFESIALVPEHLARGTAVGKGTERSLLEQIGRALRIQQQMVGRLEVSEKPEVLWDEPRLERLFIRLEEEYELDERDSALDRKLELIHRTATTLIDLQQDRRSTRLEWYIIVLIVVEIVLYVYDIFWRK